MDRMTGLVVKKRIRENMRDENKKYDNINY